MTYAEGYADATELAWERHSEPDRDELKSDERPPTWGQINACVSKVQPEPREVRRAA